MAVSYSDIQRVANIKRRVIAQSQNELGSLLSDKRGILDKVLSLVDKYGVQMQEIGAQWYEESASQAGVDVERAQINTIDLDRYSPEVEDLIAEWELGELSDEELEERLDGFLNETLTNLSRGVVFDNMRAQDVADWRISGRQARIRYARVPVGETCAWCIMLASLGPWYLSEESAGGFDPDHFHKDCDCEVVAYTDMEDIDGYADTLEAYRDMYYDARGNWENGDVPQDLKERVDRAHSEHNARYREGLTKEKWSETNEILISMRYYYGLH